MEVRIGNLFIKQYSDREGEEQYWIEGKDGDAFAISKQNLTKLLDEWFDKTI